MRPAMVTKPRGRRCAGRELAEMAGRVVGIPGPWARPRLAALKERLADVSDCPAAFSRPPVTPAAARLTNVLARFPHPRAQNVPSHACAPSARRGLVSTIVAGCRHDRIVPSSPKADSTRPGPSSASTGSCDATVLDAEDLPPETRVVLSESEVRGCLANVWRWLRVDGG